VNRDQQIATIPGEARPYQGRHAGLVTRVAANAVDALVVVAVLVAMYVGWSAFLLLLDGRDFSFPTPTFALAYVAGVVVLTLYFTAAWSTTGRTYGDHLLGLRIVDARGARIHFGRAFLRAVICVAFPVGLLWCLVSHQNRSIQDLVVRTSVIYDWNVRPGGSAAA